MPNPIATLTSTSATSDLVVSPGFVKYLYKGMPVSLVGDSISGANCVGVISNTTAIKYTYGGKPRAVVTSIITGSNPVTGVPISVPVAFSNVVNILS